MPKGSCLCGTIQYEFQGAPISYIACHCLPCQKTSGQSHSLNLTVPTSAFQLTAGTPKTFTRKGDSGKNLTYQFCPNCPGIITVYAEAFPKVYIIKWGTLDDRDLLDQAYPQEEVYTRNRYKRLKPYEGVPQAEGA